MNRSNGSSPDWSITRGGQSGPTARAGVTEAAATSDFLQLDPREAPRGGLGDWLARRVREAIADGRLTTGSRLPATRTLAAELGVSRGVVTEAYRRLTEDGHVAGRGRGGTVVVAVPPPPPPRPAAARAASAAPTSRPDLFTAPPDLGVFDALRAAPARVDLAPGLPDLAAFPRAAWLRAERAVLAGLTPSDFGYGDPRGTPALRAAVTRWLSLNRGIVADPDDVMIVNGTAQALRLLVDVLRAEGITDVAVEEPGSLGVRQHLRPLGTPPVPVDAHGVRVDALRATGARAVLLTPAHQFPTGVVLGGGRRRELMDWARDGGLVIEDDYDAEHRYDRPAVPALRAQLPEHVCYAGSVSKLLAPALRLGWLLAPPAYRAALVDAKRLIDLGNAALPQLVLAHLMASGDLERHLRLIRRHHRRRRDAMIGAIRTYLPGAVVHGAAAGLHLMITLDARTYEGSDADLATAALAHGVKVHPLSWHTQLPHRPGLVLGYAAGSPTQIVEGVKVIGGLV
ncbi:MULTISPECIES: MocR-like pyridoxine biosynthesis transcription factor PdxR [Streptomyces]|uniref:MocR-like pyridoxine biosynthesis transcription factor PdxR n=1 Tax=Streptomyces TaxID=1883 RepID=UPI001E54788F|nr:MULTISPECIES: PLP-dependent aminotransferase family protein [Streptomyces]UFQ15756.1 PLP-dependent aminotransferase family protein [Streptomyces huasconensis]WCL85360.1 PLP-dependent aminotransferase family protein [Streptomyces sp. JCM 35825]